MDVARNKKIAKMNFGCVNLDAGCCGVQMINRLEKKNMNGLKEMLIHPITGGAYEEEVYKDFYKQCYRTLAKSVHPDNSDGNMEAMQYLNQLKVMWGI